MGLFYFDESIHERGEFILGAFVYSQLDPTPAISRALMSVGLQPGVDEFKSSSRMSLEPLQSRLRLHMKRMFRDTKLGLVVVPFTDRATLGDEALRGLKKLLTANKMSSDQHQVYFDQGVMFSNRNGLITSLSLGDNCEFYFEQDSRLISGIQIADLAAHTFSVMMLEALGLVSKKVKANDNSGYDPDLDIELGFELWASVRNYFFTLDRIDSDQEQQDGFTLDTATYALYVSPSCSSQVASAAYRRFGSTYLGCIH